MTLESPVMENGEVNVSFGGEFSYDDRTFDRLKLAQDALIEDLECKIVVSSVVSQAVLNGIVKALSNESAELVGEKEAEIRSLKRTIQENAEKTSLQLRSYSHKLNESEIFMLEKERELCKMAESMVDLSFRLQGESLNNTALEKKIKEVEAKEAAKQRKINCLVEDIESLKRETSSEVESLRREMRIKEIRHREQLEETINEYEAQLAVLREENSEKLSRITDLVASQELVNEEVCRLIEAQKESMEEIEKFRVTLEEQKMLHDQEVNVLLDLYQGQIHELHGGFNWRAEEEKMIRDMETDILTTYFSSFVEFLDEKPRVVQEREIHNPKDELDSVLTQYSDSYMDAENGTSVIEDMVEREAKELETDIILDCFIGFMEDVKQALSQLDLQEEQAICFFKLLSQVQKGINMQRRHSSLKPLKQQPAEAIQGKLFEQHQHHQLEMDILLDFFMGKLTELYAFVMERSKNELADADKGNFATEFANLQRENATLRREKDQVLIQKTEEMFRLKRDFFKELDKQKLESEEFGLLKRQFVDSRQKLDRILDKKYGVSTEDHSDSDLISQEGDSATNDLKFTEDFPLLVSELQSDIEQLIFDTGNAKPDDSTHKSYRELQNQFNVLNLEYEAVLKALEDEKEQKHLLMADLQQQEHNVNLSNKELERLLRLLELEKQARLHKEGELQNIKQDVTLVRRQMESVLSQLENERTLKKRMQGDLENLQKQVELSNQRLEALQEELQDVLKVKAAIGEDNKKWRSEVLSLHKGISNVRNEIKRFTENQSRVMSNGFTKLKQAVEEKDTRLCKISDRLMKFARLNKRLHNSYVLNIQRAEDEVDLLGDENDHLVDLLERVYLALQRYSPVLQHYPGIADLSKLLKQELLSRVEQPCA